MEELLREILEELKSINSKVSSAIAYGLSDVRGIRTALEKQPAGTPGPEISAEAERPADTNERLASDDRMDSISRAEGFDEIRKNWQWAMEWLKDSTA